MAYVKERWKGNIAEKCCKEGYLYTYNRRRNRNKGSGGWLSSANNKSCMNERIIEFIQQQTCATICCIAENGEPHCFSAFYALDARKALLHYKSSADTRHSRILSANAWVAGTILPDKLQKLAVQGIQFNGVLLPKEHKEAENAEFIYHKRYPFATAIEGDVRTLQLTEIKMTDGTLVFGEKIKWKRTG